MESTTKREGKSPARDQKKHVKSGWAVAAASLMLSMPMVSVLALEAAAQERADREKTGQPSPSDRGGDRGNAPSARESGGSDTTKSPSTAPESRGKADGAGQGTAAGQNAQGNEGARKDKAAEGSKASDKDRASEKRDQATEQSKDQSKSEQPQKKAAETKDKDGTRAGEAEKEKTGQSERSKSSESTSDKQDSDKSRAESEKARSESDKTRAEGDKSRESASAPQLDEETRKQADRKVEDVKQKVTTNDREKARDAFTRSDVKRARDVNVRVDVGVFLPRSVELYDVPTTVIDVVPAYRSYRYVEIEDAICIVDPETFVIIDVIHRGGQHASGASGGESGHGGRLVLTADQERFIREHIDHEHKADLKIRLSIGAGVPPDIELHTFPDRVISEVPAVRDFRYVVVDEGVIIVDPGQKDVVYRIEG